MLETIQTDALTVHSILRGAKRYIASQFDRGEINPDGSPRMDGMFRGGFTPAGGSKGADFDDLFADLFGRRRRPRDRRQMCAAQTDAQAEHEEPDIFGYGAARGAPCGPRRPWLEHAAAGSLLPPLAFPPRSAPVGKAATGYAP